MAAPPRTTHYRPPPTGGHWRVGKGVKKCKKVQKEVRKGGRHGELNPGPAIRDVPSRSGWTGTGRPSSRPETRPETRPVPKPVPSRNPSRPEMLRDEKSCPAPKDSYLIKLNKYATLTFYLSAIAVIFTWICGTWMYLIAPSTAPFPYEGLPSYCQGWIAYLLIGYWYSFQVLRILTNFAFPTISIILYVICLFPLITNHLRADLPTLSRKFEELRDPVNLSVLYRSAEIGHNLFLESSGYLIIPAQFLVGQFTLLVNYSLITKWSVIQIPAKGAMMSTSLMVQAAWLGFITFGTWFNNNSVKVLQSWKKLPCNGKEAKYMAKFRKSCRPLYIGYPGMLRIRKVTVLKYVQGVTRVPLVTPWTYFSTAFRVLLGLKDE
ncbi:hypothetical protein Fcan01_11455 [Folsomia candida]|uniref:Uncharacterized protein n=1 Tax=Folsomia candida TaxID=158441 RepID=A0A226E9V0_FOLCA|nr:hypothetical protein Fcan01_11455 [Folsomia candida]